MANATTTEITEAAGQLEGQARQDAKDGLATDLPGIEADAAKAGSDLSTDADKLNDDILDLAKDIGSKVFGDAKADLDAFIAKLPEPVSYLLQGMAGSAEAAIGALGTQSYMQLSGEEKQLIEKTKKALGSVVALADSFFERASK